MHWCTKGSEHALSRQEQEINKSIFHHTRLFSLYHKPQHQSFWIFWRGGCIWKQTCSVMKRDIRHVIMSVLFVGAFLAFVFVFLFTVWLILALLIHFSSADSLALEDQKQNDFLQCYVFSYILLVAFPESLHATSSACVECCSTLHFVYESPWSSLFRYLSSAKLWTGGASISKYICFF